MIPELPSGVRHLRLDSRDVYVVPVAHVSAQSVTDVEATLAAVVPDTVCVELCAARLSTLLDRESWRRLDVFRILREGKAMLLLSSLLMSSFQRRIGKALGVTPGAEQVVAARWAEANGAELVLADRDIQITLKRTWGKVGFLTRLRLLFTLPAGLFASADVSAEEIEKIREEEEISDLLSALAAELPGVHEPLIEERDAYLAEKIRTAPGERIVAVIGAGHVPGLVERIAEPTDLAPLEVLPRPARWPKVVGWAIPVALVAVVAWGFLSGQADRSRDAIILWTLVNGTLSAAGAALALGHPLTILSAFVAAPLTSLNPMVAAGWVAGLVQAWIRRPTVQDLEELPEDISTFSGFWRNGVSRILLVVALSNLGSMAGTFLAGGWIAARTL